MSVFRSVARSSAIKWVVLGVVLVMAIAVYRAQATSELNHTVLEKPTSLITNIQADPAKAPKAIEFTAPYIRDFSKPFDQYTWVAAHNAYLEDTTALLELGVRGLLWDLWLKTNPSEVWLCHNHVFNDLMGNCSASAARRKLFSTELQKVMDFLNRPENKSAVVTIYFERRVEYGYIETALNTVAGLEPLLFNPAHYKDLARWPTLQTIIDSGRRIIIFSDRDELRYVLDGVDHRVLHDKSWMTQTTYDLKSPVSDNWDCKTRWVDISLDPGLVSSGDMSDWNRLLVINQMHAFGSSPWHAGQIDNNLTWLEYRVDAACAKAGNESVGVRKVPNYFVLDFLEVGDAFAYSAALTSGGVYFYEENDGESEGHPFIPARSLNNKDVVCVLPMSMEWDIKLGSTGCENDEARSLALRGVKKGTSIKVYDSPGASKGDDYAVIEVKRDIRLDERVVVPSFEKSYSNNDVSVESFYKNGLDGKVSHITIEPTTGSVDPKIEFRDDEGNFVCSVPAFSDISFEMKSGNEYGCGNDAVQSLTLTHGQAGSTITLFGTPGNNENCSQGCLRLFVRKDMAAPFTLNNIDRSLTFGKPLESADGSVVAVRYGGDQQLAGKVSWMTIKTDTENFGFRDVIPVSAEADGSWGGWGAEAKCPVGNPAWGFVLRAEKDQGQEGDNSGLNDIKMDCSATAPSAFIRSAGGRWGDETNLYKCTSSNGPLKGFKLKTLWPRDHRDEVVATDLIGICQDGTQIGPALYTWGEWSSDFVCPANEQVVGFITRVESDQGSGDDSALNGVRMFCANTTAPIKPLVPHLYQLSAEKAVVYWDEDPSQAGMAEVEVWGDGKKLLTTHYNYEEVDIASVNSLSLKAVDANGIVTTSEVVNIPLYDGTSPSQVKGLRVENMQEASVKVSWDAAVPEDKVESYELSYNGVPYGTTFETMMYIPDVEVPKNFTFQVRAFKTNAKFSEPASIIVDRTPPTAPATLTSSEREPTSLKLSWPVATDDIKLQGYEVFKDEVSIAKVAVNEYRVNGLKPNENHTFSIKAIDTTDNSSAAVSLFVDRENPMTPLNVVYSDLTATSVKLAWAKPGDNVEVTGYRVTRDGVILKTLTDLFYVDTALAPLTTYTYEIYALDEMGNASQPGVLVLDRVPPSKPHSFSLTDDTGTSFKLSWQAEDAVGVAGYDIYLNGELFHSTTNSYTFRRVESGVSYTIEVEAIDAMGNLSETGVFNADRVSPAMPAFPVIRDDKGVSLILEWDPVELADVAGYSVFKDAVKIADTPVNRFEVTGLDVDKNYEFGIETFDTSNNKSPRLLAFRNTPPTVRHVTVEPLSQNGFEIKWDSALANTNTVLYGVYLDNVLQQQVSEPFVLIRDVVGFNIHHVEVVALNAAGDRSVPATLEVDWRLPHPPKLLTFQWAGQNLVVQWLPPTDVNVIEHDVKINDANWVKSSSLTEHLMPSANKNEVYKIHVRAAYSFFRYSEPAKLTVGLNAEPAVATTVMSEVDEHGNVLISPPSVFSERAPFEYQDDQGVMLLADETPYQFHVPVSADKKQLTFKVFSRSEEGVVSAAELKTVDLTHPTA